MADKDKVTPSASSRMCSKGKRPRREPRALMGDPSERRRLVEVAAALGGPLPALAAVAVAALAGPLDLPWPT